MAVWEPKAYVFGNGDVPSSCGHNLGPACPTLSNIPTLHLRTLSQVLLRHPQYMTASYAHSHAQPAQNKTTQQHSAAQSN